MSCTYSDVVELSPHSYNFFPFFVETPFLNWRCL